MTDPSLDFRTAILTALGHAPDVIEPGRLHRFATGGLRGDSAGWCRLFPDGRAGVFGDWRTGATVETWTAADRASLSPKQRRALAREVAAITAERELVQRRQWAESAVRNARTWAKCVQVTQGDPVALYRARRGLAAAWPPPACLRLHPALEYWHLGEKLGTFPAMVAQVMSPGGRVVALHRTYLAEDGRKADVPTPKKLTPASGPVAGACIPLYRPALGALGVAEGIETAEAARLGSGVPTVAAYAAGNLAAWRWPAGVRRIVIFADADKAGRDAGEALRTRARAAGLWADMLTPTDDGVDWADVWAEREAASAEGASA